MTTEIYADFTLEAAHYLPHVAQGHKCRSMHGHTYRCTVRVRGEISKDLGWIIDYETIDASWHKRVHARLDHSIINDTPGLENSTSENMARWIFGEMREDLPGIHSVTVRETSRCGATYICPGIG